MRSRLIPGLAAGAILILSSLSHTFLAWPQLQVQLAAVNAPADLVQGLGIGWVFGGVAMLAFGLLAILATLAQRRGIPGQGATLLLIGIAYTLFGAATLALTRDPLFLLFLVPGLLLLVAGRGQRG